MDKVGVARSSLFAAVGLTFFKLIVALMTGSLGILSEAVHSFLDLLAAAMTLFAVRISDKPADKEHQYGHGKFENLSALFETLLLVITCFWIISEAFHRLSSGKLDITVNVWSFVVVAAAIVVDVSRSRALSRAAKKYHSQALEADALHFSSDIFSSVVVLLGLVCYRLDIKAADSVASIIVSLIVLGVGWRLGKRAVSVLVDRAPDGVKERVDEVLATLPDVLRVHDIRIRSAGADVIINLNIHARPDSSLAEAHNLSDTVEQHLSAAIPNSRVHVHVEPDAHEDETGSARGPA